MEATNEEDGVGRARHMRDVSNVVVAMPFNQAIWGNVPFLPWLPRQVLDHVVVTLMDDKLLKEALVDLDVWPGDHVHRLCGVSSHHLLLSHQQLGLQAQYCP